MSSNFDPRRGGGRPGRPTRPLDQVRAPYTFVPLSGFVVDGNSCPELDAAAASRDIPFKDGLSGTLQLEVEPVGPIAMRGREDRGVARFATWPGTDDPFLPGSALRGLIRNTVEIASFARLKRFNDSRYAVRDLHNRELYLQHMAGLVPVGRTGKNEPMPFVSAGWLERNDGPDAGVQPAILHPCSFAKIHYKFLHALADHFKNGAFQPGRKQSAPDKYQAWGDLPRQFKFQVTTKIEEHRPPRGAPPRRGDFGVVTRLGGDGSVPGTLVFTGQPSEWRADAPPKGKGAGNPKQHDFVFYDRPGARIEPIPVGKRTYEDFLFIHSRGGERHQLTDDANAELKHWLNETGWESGGSGRIPVFFLLRENRETRAQEVRAIGLAMMFRLAYDRSVGEAVQHVQGPDEGKWDLADLIFGQVPTNQRDDDDKAHRGLAGRVAFGHGRPKGRFQEGEEVRAVFGAPKASFYPNYVEQKADADGHAGEHPPSGRDGRPVWKTWMDADARPRGWKRVRPLLETLTPTLPTDSRGAPLNNDKVTTRFRPIRAKGDGVFTLPLQVHNLRPFELGAVLWALDFGEAPGTFHTFGLARSLGYGKLRIRVVGHHLTANDPKAGAKVELAALRRAYAEFMENALAGGRVKGGWVQSRQIFELVEAARPAESAQTQRHMSLRHPDHGNEFQLAKSQGLALASAGSSKTWAAGMEGWAPGERTEVDWAIPADGASTEATASPDDVDVATPHDVVVPLEEQLKQAKVAGRHWALLEALADQGANDHDRRVASAFVNANFNNKKVKQERLDRKKLFAWLDGEARG